MSEPETTAPDILDFADPQAEYERLHSALIKIANEWVSPASHARVTLGTQRLCDTDYVDAYHCRSEACRRKGGCAGIREALNV